MDYIKQSLYISLTFFSTFLKEKIYGFTLPSCCDDKKTYKNCDKFTSNVFVLVCCIFSLLWLENKILVDENQIFLKIGQKTQLKDF